MKHRLIITQHSEDSSSWTAICGDYPNAQRCIIKTDSMEDAIEQAKQWCAYRGIEFGSVTAYSNQG